MTDWWWKEGFTPRAIRHVCPYWHLPSSGVISSYIWVLCLEGASWGTHTLGTFQKYPLFRPPSTTSGILPIPGLLCRQGQQFHLAYHARNVVSHTHTHKEGHYTHAQTHTRSAATYTHIYTHMRTHAHKHTHTHSTVTHKHAPTHTPSYTYTLAPYIHIGPCLCLMYSSSHRHVSVLCTPPRILMSIS